MRTVKDDMLTAEAEDWVLALNMVRGNPEYDARARAITALYEAEDRILASPKAVILPELVGHKFDTAFRVGNGLKLIFMAYAKIDGALAFSKFIVRYVGSDEDLAWAHEGAVTKTLKEICDYLPSQFACISNFCANYTKIEFDRDKPEFRVDIYFEI